MKTVIIGGGLAGLSAGYVLSKSNKDAIVIEKNDKVGGLARTVHRGCYAFDLGGHRFWTKKDDINDFMKDLMKDELIVVPRVSKIYFNGKFIDYPLEPVNAIFSVGILKSAHIIADYLMIKARNASKDDDPSSIENWLVNRFGRALHEIYFKPYTEKIWGMQCSEISADWASQRIKGISLRGAAMNALPKIFRKTKTAKLADEFMYPKSGIQEIPDRLADGMNVLLNEEVMKINHKKGRIISVKTASRTIKGENFISTMPITELVQKMDSPKEIIEESRKLRYRDLVFVCLVINRESITKDTWTYFHDSGIPFGKMLEMKNWSSKMVKDGTTSLVLEFFCSEGDNVWKEDDKKLINSGIMHLVKLGFFSEDDVMDSFVVRAKKTYPVYNIGYKDSLDRIKSYLRQFRNLQIIGRNGTFRYINMDHALEMGIKAAENIISEDYELHDLEKIGSEKEYLEGMMDNH